VGNPDSQLIVTASREGELRQIMRDLEVLGSLYALYSYSEVGEAGTSLRFYLGCLRLRARVQKKACLDHLTRLLACAHNPTLRYPFLVVGGGPQPSAKNMENSGVAGTTQPREKGNFVCKMPERVKTLR